MAALTARRGERGARRWLGVGVLLFAVLALAACGDDDGSGGGDAAADDDVVETCDVDAVVFVQPEADQAQVDAIEQQLEGVAEVDEVRYLDAEATQPRFGELFADVPADSTEQPTSFEVVFGGSVDRATFVEDLYLTEGVGEVAFVSETC